MNNEITDKNLARLKTYIKKFDLVFPSNEAIIISNNVYNVPQMKKRFIAIDILYSFTKVIDDLLKKLNSFGNALSEPSDYAIQLAMKVWSKPTIRDMVVDHHLTYAFAQIIDKLIKDYESKLQTLRVLYEADGLDND